MVPPPRARSGEWALVPSYRVPQGHDQTPAGFACIPIFSQFSTYGTRKATNIRPATEEVSFEISMVRIVVYTDLFQIPLGVMVLITSEENVTVTSVC